MKGNKNVTVFKITTHGYFETGDRKGQVNPVCVRDRVFEVYEGVFYVYQKSLKINQVVEKLSHNPTDPHSDLDPADLPFGSQSR